MITVHPRTLIRHAVVAVLKHNPAVTAVCGPRIFANREEPWGEDELPAMGVYQTAETPLETDKNPPPDERALSLSFEVLARGNEHLEDVLDTVSLALEQGLDLNVIGAELGEYDTLLQLKFDGFELGLADDGRRLVGVATLTYTLEYGMPPKVPAFDSLPDYLLSYTAWDLFDSDHRVLDAEDLVNMPGWDVPAKE